MASQQHYDAVFEEPEDDDEEPSSSDNELDVNDDALDDEELLEEEEDVNSPPLLPQPIAAATSALSSASIPSVPLAVPSSAVVTVAAVPTDESPPDSKRQRVESAVMEKKPPPPPPSQFDESRRLFQRLWTDEDEIELLQGFLDYTTSRMSSNSSSSHHHHHDTALFYDQIKSKLQLDFNKNQLVEKLRRLKKKYRNVMNKINSGKDFSFKSPHDQATFEISRKIWSNSVGKVEDNVLDDDENNNNNINMNLIEEKNFTPKSSAAKKRSRSKAGKMEEKRVVNDGFAVATPAITHNINNNNNLNNLNNRSNIENGTMEGFGGGGGCGVGGGGGGNVVGVIEDTVRSFLTPLFKELLGSVMGGGGGGGGCGGRGISGLAMNAMPLNFGGSLNFGGGGGGSNGELMDERWRKQQILELEVYSKRLELVQDQIKAALQELRSMGG